MPEEKEEEVLKTLNNDEIVELREVYKQHVDKAPHVISLIDTKLRWNKDGREDDLMLFMSPGDSYKTDGTFIVLKQILAHEVFVYTLDPKCRNLYNALMETNKIDFKKVHLFVIVDTSHHWTLTEFIDDIGMTLKYTNACDMYCLPKDLALNFDIKCPPDVYIKQLDKSVAPTINAVWPHRYEGSEKYLADMIELNGGYGLFIKETDELASWIIKNVFGQLGMVQTLDKFRKRSYGSLVTKYMCKEIAKEGHHPFGTVLVENVASQAMFKKLGFISLGLCYYLGVES